MRTVAWWLVGSLTLVVMGCSGGGTSSPTAPSTNGSSLPAGTETTPISTSGSLGTAVQKGDLQTSALAIYTVDVNPNTLTATSRLKETRSGQANDDLYMLSIDSFLNAGSFAISGVSADATSVSLDYVVTHPFPAPSAPTGTPNGSTNRADLGISGMVLFLADVPSATGNTYFTDRVANTALVTNADAYYSPGGLLTTTGTANTYPYRQLVDEVADSRVGITNGGSTSGNFGADGWTRAEFGGTNDGWTGFGVLHQGQSSQNTVSLDKNELVGGFSLDVAIVAKYNDPRGGTTGAQKKANRLPPAAADAAAFAYRMPHGALDGAAIVVESEPAGFIANTISSAQVSIHVMDWDAAATETVAADLSADTAFGTVAVGESGAPTVEVCIPGVLGDATFVAPVATVVDDDSLYPGGDPGVDTGAAGDSLFYSDLLTKAAGTGQVDGDFTGMARVTDPETGLLIGLDGSLAPLPTAPAPVTYQSFTIAMLPDNAPPSAVVTLLSANPMNSGTQASVGITSITDVDADNLAISVDWGNGGGFVTVAAAHPSPYVNLTPSSPNMNNTDLVVDAISVTVRVDDGTAAPVDYVVGYNLGANRPPQVTGTPALASASVVSPATFTMNAGTTTAVDPEGDTISRTITNNANANVVTFAAFPNAANTTAIVPVGPVNFTTYANDALHPTVAGTAYPVVVGTVTSPCAAATVGNITLATLIGAAPRSLLTDTGAVTGVRITWTAAAAATHYGIYRAPWAAGTALATATAGFVKVGEVVAPTVTFDHNAASTVPFVAANTQGLRWIYTVRSGCGVGSTNQPDSQYGIISFQDFEGITSGTVVENTVNNGWAFPVADAASSQVTVLNTGTTITNNSLNFFEVGVDGLDDWFTFTAPDMSPADYLTLKPTLARNMFEFAYLNSIPGGGSTSSGWTIASRVGAAPAGGGSGNCLAGSLPWSTTQFTAGVNRLTGTFGWVSCGGDGGFTWTDPVVAWRAPAATLVTVGFSQYNGFAISNPTNLTSTGIHGTEYVNSPTSNYRWDNMAQIQD